MLVLTLLKASFILFLLFRISPPITFLYFPILSQKDVFNQQKLQLILKQKFTLHDASRFPDPNPKIGNKEKDGNIIFMMDDQQIPHRIFFRNREEYEIIDWFLERTNKQNLNMITVDWSKYINNVKKIRGDQVDRYPIMMTRQWWYYKDKDCVQQYIIHSQALWYLYSQFQIKNPSKINILNQVIAVQMNEYQNRWIQLLQDDGQTNWLETTESSLILAATENMNESIKQQYDNEKTNYVLDVKEDIWFTNSSINMVCYYHKTSMITKTLVIYVKLLGYCYYTNMTTEQIVANMFLFGISFLNSPSFEVVDSNELICWLCGRVSQGWSEMYAHECKQRQRVQKVGDILQSWNLRQSSN